MSAAAPAGPAAPGLCLGTGEVIGGVFAPSIAGAAAGAWGLAMPLWIMLGLAVAAGLLATGPEETAPGRRRRATG